MVIKKKLGIDIEDGFQFVCICSCYSVIIEEIYYINPSIYKYTYWILQIKMKFYELVKISEGRFMY